MRLKQYLTMLGREATDKITGFKGIIITVAFDVSGCIQVVLKPGVDSDGKMREGEWFDVNRLTFGISAAEMTPPEFKPLDPEDVSGPVEKPSRGTF